MSCFSRRSKLSVKAFPKISNFSIRTQMVISSQSAAKKTSRRLMPVWLTLDSLSRAPSSRLVSPLSQISQWDPQSSNLSNILPRIEALVRISKTSHARRTNQELSKLETVLELEATSLTFKAWMPRLMLETWLTTSNRAWTHKQSELTKKNLML